jgi:hypothetical protein
MANNQISTATNLQGPNIAPSTDPRVYFNNLYALPFNISANNSDAINAFFEEYAGDKVAGDNLAAVVVYTALAQNINPMQILTDFQNLSKNELNGYLTTFLNANRVPTSILGTRQSLTTNQFVNRAILA